ncbi:sterol 26-hydroxylase, mitochondrial isoform X2 [Solea solea]|uniref:sterol 26-hydroxylase, mitochondrial isoform X2 n=1 Tax=Solea solea TaxID=90069 RepID=UPI00272B4A12|nr:sterol 26-hydroxylase, mitochondrial isoform X2 [Solea solea]
MDVRATVAVRSLRLSALYARTLSAVRPGPELRCGGPGAILVRRNMTVQTATETAGLKTIDDLPGPSVSTSLYMIFFKGFLKKYHLMQGLQKSMYGPIWRSKMGTYKMVNVASPELIAQVIQQEGLYPVRFDMQHWRDYRDLRGQAYGLHVSTGPEWHHLRSVLNPGLLKMKAVTGYASVIHEVVGDLLQRIEVLRSRSQDKATVPDVAAEFYKFGFEAISAVLFETRLGCLEEDIPKDTQKFIAGVNDMLSLSQILVIFPRWSYNILPFWKRFVRAWDDLHGVAETLIDRRVAEIEAQVKRGETPEGMYLTHLLSSEQMSRANVYVTVTELLLGGVDTTSNTLSWALFHLAKDNRAQDQLYREVNAVCPDQRAPTTADLSRMPYLKAVVKETLRLYPVVPGNGRIVSENEVVLDNYWFPKKTLFHLCHYAVSHDEAEFPDAERFIPERWLRTETPGADSVAPMPGSYQHHPYSFIPFGVKGRGCVGKRLAEMELYFTLSRLLQRYNVQPEPGVTTIEPITRTLLVPEKPINLRFLPRAQ